MVCVGGAVTRIQPQPEQAPLEEGMVCVWGGGCGDQDPAPA